MYQTLDFISNTTFPAVTSHTCNSSPAESGGRRMRSSRPSSCTRTRKGGHYRIQETLSQKQKQSLTIKKCSSGLFFLIILKKTVLETVNILCIKLSPNILVLVHFNFYFSLPLSYNFIINCSADFLIQVYTV